MSEQLLPCPFCSGEAEIGYARFDYNNWCAYCKACGATVQTDFGEAEAVEAWNRRAEPVMGITMTESLTCNGCIYFEDDHEFDPCQGCKRMVRVNDYYRQKPEGGEG